MSDQQPVTRGGTRKSWLVFAAGVAIALVAGFGLGAYRANSSLAEARGSAAQVASQAHTVVADLVDNLTRAERRIDRLEARRRLELAASALEQDNFGIAQTELEVARLLLEQSQPAPGSELQAVEQELAGLKLTPAKDRSEQQQTIAQLAARLDQSPDFLAAASRWRE